jgi:hypothetical protein
MSEGEDDSEPGGLIMAIAVSTVIWAIWSMAMVAVGYTLDGC